MKIHAPDRKFEIVSNPEFLAAGTAVFDLLYPSRVLIGSAKTETGVAAGRALARLYSWIRPERIITVNVYSSELAKLVANSMLAQRISSINSISAICEATGADVDEVARAIGADDRIGAKFLQAGIGFGGSCFKKDISSLVYLAQCLGLATVADYWTGVLRINDWQRARFAEKVVRSLNNTAAGKKICVFGYAFKKNTNDTREAPALDLVRTVLAENPREVAIYDPCCGVDFIEAEIASLLGREHLRAHGGPVHVYGDPYAAAADATAICVMNESDEFRSTPAVAAGSETASPSADDTGLITPLTPAEEDLHLVASATSTSSSSTSLSSMSSGGATAAERERAPGADLGLLDLYNYLKLRSGGSEDFVDGPFRAQPACEAGCPDCKDHLAGTTPAATKSGGSRQRPLDWDAIARDMKRPKWIFDSKGVVSREAMADIDPQVKVVAIGK